MNTPMVNDILLAILKSQLLIKQARLDCLAKRFTKAGDSWVLDDEVAVINEIQRQIDEIEMGDML